MITASKYILSVHTNEVVVLLCFNVLLHFRLITFMIYLHGKLTCVCTIIRYIASYIAFSKERGCSMLEHC